MPPMPNGASSRNNGGDEMTTRPPIKWELVSVRSECGYHEPLSRHKVPGGWLYKEGYGPAMTFVPEPPLPEC